VKNMRRDLEAFAISVAGQTSRPNGDDWLVDTERCLFAVADGVGGRPGGADASRLGISTAANHFLSSLTKEHEDLAQALREGFRRANAALLSLGSREPELSGISTTLTMLALDAHTGHITHVGDSRLYQVHDGELVQLTEDQNLRAEMVRKRRLTESTAARHPLRGMLLNVIGSESYAGPSQNELSVEPNDLLLLCTDGLADAMPNEEIAALLKAHRGSSARSICKAVVEATAGRTADDVTVVVVRVLA